MANVWFVQRIGGVWKKVGEQPAFQRPLAELIFRIDLGPQRRQAIAPEPADETTDGVTPRTKVVVEVTEDDVREAYFGGYFPGWYDSPYAALEVGRRLSQARPAEAAAHGR